jgi:hypothetical protein
LPSFAHKKLIERIARLDETPDDPAAYADWFKSGGHLSLLRDNADEELIVYASGDYTFFHAAVISNDKLSPVNKDDLLRWSCNPYQPLASYVSGGGREDVWIDRGMHASGAQTLKGTANLSSGESSSDRRKMTGLTTKSLKCTRI